MNEAQTRAEANRQIRLLMLHSTHGEQERLKKYIKPIPESIPPEVVHQSEPVHISAILPVVMNQIEQRCKETMKP